MREVSEPQEHQDNLVIRAPQVHPDAMEMMEELALQVPLEPLVRLVHLEVVAHQVPQALKGPLAPLVLLAHLGVLLV